MSLDSMCRKAHKLSTGHREFLCLLYKLYENSSQEHALIFSAVFKKDLQEGGLSPIFAAIRPNSLQRRRPWPCVCHLSLPIKRLSRSMVNYRVASALSGSKFSLEMSGTSFSVRNGRSIYLVDGNGESDFCT